MRMLLTGCTGWLGQSIVPYFAERYECDVLTRNERHPSLAHGTLIIGDAQTVRLPFNYDFIIHGALDGAKNIIKQAGDAKVLFMSSGAVYNRQTPYADLKRRDEKILKNKAIIARMFCFIGPNMPEHFAAGEFLACARNHRELVVKNPMVVRSYVHVDDLPSSIDMALSSISHGTTIDMCSSDAVTMLNLACRIGQLTGSTIKVMPGTDRDRYLPEGPNIVSIDGCIRRSL